MKRCASYHDGHDCTVPGACGRALLAMLDRTVGRVPVDSDPTPPYGLTRPKIVRALRP